MATTRGQHLIGKVIGECLLEKLLGYGGSSAVFLAQQYVPERKVAVKVFLPRSNMELQMQRDFYRRFLLEAESASGLHHPNILSIYSYGEQDGLPYIIMPYVPGGTLYDYVIENGPLSLQEAGSYLQQMASALDYAHRQGCIHCDVKPANILLDGQGHGILSDFGIARALQPDPASDNPQQQVAKSPEILLGTPNYISPEQALGQPLDGRSDIYSLGVTLFFLLTGQPPFQAESSIAMALMHVHEQPPSLFTLRADISRQLDLVVRKALAKSPDNRFQHAHEFSEAFAQAILTSVSLAQTDKRAIVKGRVSRQGGSGARIPIAGSKPVIYVQPLRHIPPIFRSSWIAFAAVVLLLLMLCGTLSAILITSHVASNTLTAQVQPTVSSNNSNSSDCLANTQDWPASSTFFFAQGQYHIQNKSARNVALAQYARHTYADLRLTVTTVQLHGLLDGADYYGVVLRSAGDQSHYYLFEVAAWNGGQYAFLRYNGQYQTLATGPAPSLHLRKGRSNTITVEAVGNTFTFFINGKAVGAPVTDFSSSLLASGGVGLYVEEQGAEVAFSHLLIVPLK